MIRRASAVATLAASVLVTAHAAPAMAPRAVSPITDTRCTVTLTPTSQGHRARYSTRCNFEQTFIRVRSDSFVTGVNPSPRLSGDVDPRDGISCQDSGRHVATCEGHAGSGVRVGGYLETGELSCNVATRFRVTGGIDCDGNQVCPAIAFIIRRRFEQPRGC